METFQNLDLFSVGLTTAAIGILGFAVFSNNRKSITNTTFLTFAVVTILWGVTNYFAYRVESAILGLWLFRVVIALAVWHAFFMFQLFFVFPKADIIFPKFYKFFLVPLVGLTSIINLTNLVFARIGSVSPTGKLDKIVNGPAIPLFGSLVFFLVISGITLLIIKMKKAKDIEKTQFLYVLIGTVATFILLITFNFILPAFFDNPTYIPLGAVFIFPFVAFTSYAIFKHHLLNVKVIATEILTFVLSVASLLEVILSKDLPVLILRSSIFLLVLAIGVLLIRSVRKEVEQREQLQILTKKLEAANERLKVLDKARAEFITMASHQLRTPPASIKWHLSALLAGDFGEVSPEVKTIVTKTNLTNNALIALIEDMLNVSRIERGKMEFAFEPTDMQEITQMTVDQLIPQAEFKKIQLVFNTPKTKLPLINIDKEKVRQVINNLIDNAIKYTREGQVKVALEKTDKDIVVKVADTGKGVAKAEIGKIFEKFGRGKDSQNYSAGLGLGLYLAQVVITQHQGKIWVESPGVNKGSTFAFSLPLKSPLKSDSLTLDLTKSQNNGKGRAG